MRQEHQNRRVHLARFERTSPSAVNKLGSKLEKTSLRTQAFLVAMRLGVTPVPIPNTMVKTQTAEGTALETVWESRWPPNLKEQKTLFRIRKLQKSKARKNLAKNSEVPTD